jgi:hypothetical protein
MKFQSKFNDFQDLPAQKARRCKKSAVKDRQKEHNDLSFDKHQQKCPNYIQGQHPSIKDP